MARTIHTDYALAYPELVGTTVKSTQSKLNALAARLRREGTIIGSGPKGYYWIAGQSELVHAHKDSQRGAMVRHGTAKRIKAAVEKYNQLEFEV